jgi:hypothetical protein
VNPQATPESEAQALERDLAMMENADGNWDDSDDDDAAELRHSISRATLTSAASSNDVPSMDEVVGAVDIWDL